MILIFSSFITNQRSNNRYSRYDIFKYTLDSYKDIPFTDIYLFILLDNEFKHLEYSLTDYIYTTFSRLSKDKINITYDRYVRQSQWLPFINYIVEKHGIDELAWFTQNDDHVFVDYNMDIVNEGIELLKKDPTEHKSIYLSHWPEILKMSGKYQEPILVNNYVKFDLSLLDSIQIFNLKLLYYVFAIYKWKNDHIRIDSVLNELTSTPSEDNPLSQTIYVPLREICRHFDGYDHVRMDRSVCGPLELPSNTFSYTKDKLIAKMTAKHYSFWAFNNNFNIPQKWIDINLSLHNNVIEHSIPDNSIKQYHKNNEIIFEKDIIHLDRHIWTPISLGWNCSPASFRAHNMNYKKENGYLTCPFDLCVTPYLALCQCILEDFDRNKFFNLRVEYDPINKQDCILNEYNMWFNHESEKQNNNVMVEWYPGKYADNNYNLFKERYEKRITNFLNYIKNSKNILFIIKNTYYDIKYLIQIIKYKYPILNFKILILNETDNIFYNQYIHSPDFPKSIDDNVHMTQFKEKINNIFNKYNMITDVNYKKHYRAIILILASNNTPVYKNCRKIWKEYMNIDPSIKVFFVYENITEEEKLDDYDKESDIIFPDIPKSIFIKKTVEAMKLIHQSFTYDFFIRTNLSTFWDFKNLHLHLNELPTKNCYSGDGPLPGYNSNGFYLSGTDTIITPEMIDSIIKNEHLVDFQLAEDAAMGKYFHKFLGVPMLPNRICFFEDITSINELDKINTRIDNAITNNKDHYRVKTLNGNREEIDMFISKQLLKKIYNILL
jgi:hypothetical protein